MAVQLDVSRSDASAMTETVDVSPGDAVTVGSHIREAGTCQLTVADVSVESWSVPIDEHDRQIGTDVVAVGTETIRVLLEEESTAGPKRDRWAAPTPERNEPRERRGFLSRAAERRGMSEIDVDELLPNERVKQSVLNGDVTQLTRGASNRYAEEGDTFSIDGETFTVVSVDRRTLGDFTDADAQREGSESLEAYKQRMKRVHAGNFEWDDSDEVMTYRFERND